MVRTALPVLALLLSAAPLWAQDKKPDEKTPRVVELIVHPAAVPQPALRYQLLPDFGDETPGNALPLYSTAALLLSHAAEMIHRQWDAVADVALDKLPREALHEHVAQFAGILRYVDLAARRDHCVWEIPIREHGMETLFPSLRRYRDIGRLLATKARLAMAEGRHDDAIRTIQTGFALARHISQGRSLIHALVAASIANLMVRQLETSSQMPGAPNLYWALTGLPRPFVDLRLGLGTERSVLYYTIPQLRTLGPAPLDAARVAALTDDLARLVAMIGSPDGNARSLADAKAQLAGWVGKGLPQAKRALAEQGLSATQIDGMPAKQAVLLAALRSYERQRDNMFKWFNVPYWQAQAGLARADKDLKTPAAREASEPFHALLPSMARPYFIVARLDRRLAALRAVEAVRLYAAAHDGALPASLADIDDIPIPTDPVTGNSVPYRRDGDTAVIDLPAPPGMTPDKGDRYVITLAR